MWGWLESNLKVTDVDVKTEVSQPEASQPEASKSEASKSEVSQPEVSKSEVSQPADDLVEKILNHMSKRNEEDNMEATDTPSDEDEEAEWEKELDKKWDRSCNEKYIELVIPRNQALLLFLGYCMNMFVFMYNTSNNVCRG